MASSVPVSGVILAAGKGTRMKSEHPKCLMPVCGLPMVEHVARAMLAAGVARPVVVIGHGAEAMRAALGEDRFAFALQAEQRGTGDALRAAFASADFEGPVLVAPGDTPLVPADAFRSLMARMAETGASAVVATFVRADPAGYGRIVRRDGAFARIVEEKDARPEERAIVEVNAALYCFDAAALEAALPKLEPANAQGEYYLTDALELIAAAGGRIETLRLDDERALMGVNDRWQLAEASRIMRQEIARSHALAGVTIVDPDTTYIGVDVAIAPDAVIEPMTVLAGRTSIGARSRVGPCTSVEDAAIGEDCVLLMSHVARARVESGVRIGPFANLRPGAHLESGVKIGNFVEVKQARIGAGTSASHLAYIGDATVGSGVNIGAGTITCNYDGFVKNRTVIEDGVFVGSNSTLVAPLTLGRDSFVAAGSVINRDVPPGGLGIGRAKQEVREGWVFEWRKRKRDG